MYQNKTCSYFNNTITSMYLDEFGCNLYTFTAYVYYYDFGYYCMAPLFLIVIISIFGTFKGNYRWFILNQIIWDLLVSYQYSCSNYLEEGVKPGPSCFYMASTYVSNKTSKLVAPLDSFAHQVIKSSPFSSPFLLLAASRFLALYFPYFYDRITNGRKILWIIIIYNLIFLIFDSLYPLFVVLNSERILYLKEECQKNSSMCVIVEKNLDSLRNFYGKMYTSLDVGQQLQPCICVFLSTILTIAIILKVAKQAVFQSKHNRKDFSASLRITIVLAIQVLMNVFVFFFYLFSEVAFKLSLWFNVKIVTGRTYVAGFERIYKLMNYLDLRLPTWFDGYYGFTAWGPLQMIKQFRILLEAFVILFIMTGYREAIVHFVKYVYAKIQKIFNHNTRVTNISQTNNRI